MKIVHSEMHVGVREETQTVLEDCFRVLANARVDIMLYQKQQKGKVQHHTVVV